MWQIHPLTTHPQPNLRTPQTIEEGRVVTRASKDLQSSRCHEQSLSIGVTTIYEKKKEKKKVKKKEKK